MLIYLLNKNGLEWLTWIVVAIAILITFTILLLFWLHRKNNRKRIAFLEEKMLEHDATVFQRTDEQMELFKKALQQHLSEIISRIQENETHTNKLVNQLDALQSFLLDNELPPDNQVDSFEEPKEVK